MIRKELSDRLMILSDGTLALLRIMRPEYAETEASEWPQS